MKTADILIKPHITEKSAIKGESSVYVFEVNKLVTKKQIEKSFKDTYKLSPIKINIVNIPQKAVFVRGKRGLRAGMKKAYVYLKKGEKIEI